MPWVLRDWKTRRTNNSTCIWRFRSPRNYGRGTHCMPLDRVVKYCFYSRALLQCLNLDIYSNVVSRVSVLWFKLVSGFKSYKPLPPSTSFPGSLPFTRRAEILGTRLCHDFFFNFLCSGVSSDLETRKMKFQPIWKIFKQKICQIYIYNVLTGALNDVLNYMYMAYSFLVSKSLHRSTMYILACKIGSSFFMSSNVCTCTSWMINLVRKPVF